MLCSIVIPWYRGISDLRRAVDSVLAQDHANFEIIVVANGVTDGAFDEVQVLYSDPRYRVVRIEEAGACPARNEGLRIAAGELVFFLDADDRFHPRKLSIVLEKYRSTGFDVAFSRGYRVRKHGVSWLWPVGFWAGEKPVAEFFFCDGCTISTSAIILAARVRDRLQFAVRGYPYDDPNLIITAEAMGLDIKMLPEALYDYFDDREDNRISQRANWTERLAWISQTPANVTPKARAAFEARCVAQHMFPNNPFLCLRIFADALARGAVPLRDLAMFVGRGLLPAQIRHNLLNLYHVRRAERSAL